MLCFSYLGVVCCGGFGLGDGFGWFVDVWLGLLVLLIVTLCIITLIVVVLLGLGFIVVDCYVGFGLVTSLVVMLFV